MTSHSPISPSSTTPTIEAAPTRRRHLPRLLTMLAALAATMLLLAACGGDDESGEPVQAGAGDDADDGAGDGDDGGEAVVPSDADGDDDLPEGPLGAGPYPIADITVTYTHEGAGVTIDYRISCLGDTATITGDDVSVTGDAACLALGNPAAIARLVDGPPADQACTQQYGGDDTAVISGTLNGEAVDTVVNRADGCGIGDWDSLFADMLPPVIGA